MCVMCRYVYNIDFVYPDLDVRSGLSRFKSAGQLKAILMPVLIWSVSQSGQVKSDYIWYKGSSIHN